MPLRSTFFLAALLAASAAEAAPGAPTCGPDKLGTERVLKVGTEGGTKVGLKTYPNSLKLEDREVVLTFDDGPFPETTGPILDALAKECVRATFFLVGRNAAANPVFVQRELREGHTLGHHSMTHPDLTLRGIAEKNPAAARAQIDDGIRADEKAAGRPVAATGSPTPGVPFFRYPGFADTPELNAWLAERHIAIFGADLWASDWNLMTPDKELQLLESRLADKGRGIILLHDTKPQTAQMLPRFLRYLKENHYRVVAIEPGPGPADLAPAPAGWSSETEASLQKIMPKLERAAAKSRDPSPGSPLARRVRPLPQGERGPRPTSSTNGDARPSPTQTGCCRFGH